MKNNELIADFMGFTNVSEMKFHTSWDWLIKVIEKIYNDFSIDDERVLLIRDALAEADFNNAYKNVVEFIKSKNQNKMDIIKKLKDLRDNTPCNEDSHKNCGCEKFDEIIDELELILNN